MPPLTSRIAGAAMFAAAATGLVAPIAANAAPPISQTECDIIAKTSSRVLRAVGPETVSTEFKQSFRSFLGKNLTCDGPTDIRTPTKQDVALFNNIRTELLAFDISLEKAGLRSVASPEKPPVPMTSAQPN